VLLLKLVEDIRKLLIPGEAVFPGSSGKLSNFHKPSSLILWSADRFRGPALLIERALAHSGEFNDNPAGLVPQK
jgi:hypothetical protein